MTALALTWRLRWKAYIMFTCVLVSSSHRMSQVTASYYQRPDPEIAQLQAAVGWALFSGIVAGMLKLIGLVVRLIAKRPAPPARRWWRTKSGWAAAAAIAFACFAGLFIPPTTMFVVLALLLPMLAFATAEARAEIAPQAATPE